MPDVKAADGVQVPADAVTGKATGMEPALRSGVSPSAGCVKAPPVHPAREVRGNFGLNEEMTMKSWMIGGLCASALLVSACDNMTADQRTVAGVAGGAAAGLIAADALKADDDWKLIAALGGAAAGTMVAQNANQKTCAYSRGDGTYYTQPCG